MIKWSLLLALTLLLAITSTTGSGFAYFNDSEGASSNGLSASTLDLKTNDADGVTQTLFNMSLEPGDTVGPATVQLRNAGSINGTTLDLAFSYTESDDAANSVNKSADETAAMMEVTTLNYDGASLLGNVPDANTNGYRDLQDLKNANLSGRSGLNTGATKAFEIAVCLRTETGMDFRNDGISLTATFTLNQ